MKRNVIAILLSVMVLSLAGCNNDKNQTTASEVASESTSIIAEENKEVNDNKEIKDDKEVKENISESSDNEEASLDEIRPEFKAAMDEYEEFYDEYCDFMKKYKNANDSMDAVNMLGDYTAMLQQMEEMDKKFKAWDSKDMTTAEAKYYVDVTAKIEKKLLDVSK